MNVEIAQRLASLRREMGYSQEALATELGLSRQAISKWERAESQPDTGNLIALADLYGVTLDELVRVDVDIADDVRFEEAEKSKQEECLVTVVATETEAIPTAETAETTEETKAAASTEAEATPTAETAEQPYDPMVSGPPPGQQPYIVENPQSAAPPKPPRQPRSPWMTFPYPLLVVVLFLLAGFLFGAWNPAWILFLTIPFYYWIAHVITSDPNYRADRNERFGR